MRFRFLLLLLALFAGVGVGYQQLAAQNIVTCPSLVQKAIQSVGSNCGGLGRNNACYGYTDVNATFNNPQPSGYFSQPSQRANVPDLETLMTSPMDESLSKWGIALMSLQANLPDTLPGQNVVFMLVGDSQIENAVKPDDTFQGGQTLSVTLQIGGNLYFQPDMSSQVVGSVPQGTALTADAVSSDGQWVRVAYGGVPGWLTKQVISTDGDLTTLPVIGADTKTPMQAFYFRTGISGTDCTQAPNALVVQGPKNLKVDIQANGANIRLGSTIVLYEIPVDPMTQQYLTDHYGDIGAVPELMQIVVLDGHVTLNPDGPNPVVLTTGTTSFVCLTQPENLGDDGLPNDRQVFNQCPWAAPRPVTEDDIEQFRYLQGVTLNYPIELPLDLPPLTPTFTPSPTDTGVPTPTRTATEITTATPTPTLAPSLTPWPTNAPTHKPTHSPDCPVNVTASTPADLIAAINKSNTTCPTSSNTITLSSGGIYEFTNSDNSTDGGNMLPVIASPITINGNGA
ncbi:MAG TPA: SH3 domain-containing protein, partial [Phototrophicaceae bacterium]|nr:SH3 domain-containing protein [Phototrophicaceae bacterium]